MSQLISAASTVFEPADLWVRELPSKYAHLAPRLVETREGLFWQIDDERSVPLDTRNLTGVHNTMAETASWLSGPEGRIWLQVRDGLSAEVLYGTSGVWSLICGQDDEPFINACYRIYNEWLADFCRSDPSRFIGLAKIPVSGIEAALAELRFVTETLKMPGIVLDRWPNGREGSARESVAFWEAAEAYAVPISVYCSLTGGDDPVELVGGGRTPELGNELPSIIYANICDRFPNLKFVVADPSPGWAPFVFEGLNESYQRTIGSRQVHLGDPEAMPADYMRAFFWYTIQDDRFCVLNRHYFGPAHLMWGSFTATLHSQWPNSPQQFGRLTSGLPAESIAALGSGVVKNLYGLEGASSFSQEEIRDFKSYAVI